MSVNSYKPHIYVLPEDDANRQLANGFLLDVSLASGAIQVLRPAGGWLKVIEDFNHVHVKEMGKYPLRHMILLIDFDEKLVRRAKVKDYIPDNISERVFVIGVWSEPEKLRRSLASSLEAIGLMLAKECQDGSSETWEHELLSHNADEVARMTEKLKPILFLQS